MIRTVQSMTKRAPERRTALVTAAGIAAVVVAGAFAVGANVGILDASSDDEIGTLSAAGDLVPTTAATPAPLTTTPATSTTAAAQTYLVDAAGTVTVTADEVIGHLHGLGVKVELGPTRKDGALGPITSVYCRDPDGNLIEIATYA